MTITQIDTNVQRLVKNFKSDRFIYDFCTAFGFPKSTVKRLETGSLNLSKTAGEVLLKKKFLYKVLNTDELTSVMESLQAKEKIKHNPRFLILTDHKTIYAFDTKTEEILESPIKKLTKEYAFFLPLAGMEKTAYRDENPADVKAAEKMAKLFDEIKKKNPTEEPAAIHSLNVFLSRLLFCFFAEDTAIFADNQFTNAIASHTQEDGSDLGAYLTQLFGVLNQAKRPKKMAEHLSAFPYVNGGLFRESHPTPEFSRKARQILIESGGMDWAAINPDIFGSMIQAVVTPEHRGGLGMHYTSVPNIMKVIEPLFLNDLYEEFLSSKNSPAKLKALLNRLSNLNIFDPACGSGNFLIIAYKELRKLENRIIQQLLLLKRAVAGFLPEQLELIPKKQQRLAAAFEVEIFSRISLHQFYGIELDDFAHEIAKLSLWLAEHQMNTLFTQAFGQITPSLPLKETGNIIHGNACRIDWETVCPKEEGKEVFILGNPPYLGFNLQTSEQKDDIRMVLPQTKNHKFLDYIVCWFVKAANYIDHNSEFAFVTTNSISQGAQAPRIWPYILNDDNEISFAYKGFIWSNNAKNKAGVICSIIGIRKLNRKSKFLYSGDSYLRVSNINIYLVDGSNTIIIKRQKPLAKISPMCTGNVPYDGGNLIINEEERNEILRTYPEAKSLILKRSGSRDFINNLSQYCIWIIDEKIDFAKSIPPIAERIKLVKKSRENGGKIARNYAHVPHRFYMNNRAKKSQIIIPRHSSIRREYIPMGFLDAKVIIADSAQAIYDPEPFVFSVLNSKIHMVWVRTVGGRIKKDYRYSAILCYNTFPFPSITDTQKSVLETHVYAVLEQRERHSEKTLAQLYDPDKMPEGLRAAHHALDLAVERCYRKEPFTSDEERLAYLFKLYEKMIAEEEEKDTLFAEEKKKGRRKKKNIT